MPGDDELTTRTRTYITVFTRACHRSLSRANWINSTSPPLHRQVRKIHSGSRKVTKKQTEKSLSTKFIIINEDVLLQNPALGVLVAQGVTSCDVKQDSGPLKPRCEASCRRLRGTEVVTAVSQTIPSGHRAAPRRMYAFHPHGLVVTV
jgi:hypothetical protein